MPTEQLLRQDVRTLVLLASNARLAVTSCVRQALTRFAVLTEAFV